ncbi:MAG: type II toxin-antitoxin system Phd/YefM family antitoxin [Kiritimatiellia bacterium]
MKTATVRQIHNEFSQVLEWVKSGEEVLVKRRRSVVARILPPPRQNTEVVLPDFMVRIRKQFGAEVTPDSSTLFDEMRGAR